MPRIVLFIDGAVGVGKTTFIGALEKAIGTAHSIVCAGHARANRPTVEVVKEPLYRGITEGLCGRLDGGYKSLLDFIVCRKISSIDEWNRRICADGMQALESNVLIVERSLKGDGAVMGVGVEKELPKMPGVDIYNVLILNGLGTEMSDEEARLAEIYRATGDRAIMRPEKPSKWLCHASDVYEEIIAPKGGRNG